MTKPHIKRPAFTLLEMLAATAMIAVLAGSLYASLNIAFKARRSAMAAVGPVRKVELVMELIEQDIRSAAVPNGILAGTFTGQDDKDDRGHDSDYLVFFCTTPSPASALGVGDIKKVELYCELSGDGRSVNLVRHVTTNLLSPQVVEPAREILCRGVFMFNLRYFNGTDWVDNWDSTTVSNTLPLAIEVTFQLDDDKQANPTIGGYLTSRVYRIPCGDLPSTAAQTAASTTLP